jgi:hypothetical protein
MQENYHDDTQEISNLLSKFKPVPSERFYSRMSTSPWNRKFSSARLALQISAAVVVILLLVNLIPVSSLFVAPPYTPTSTQYSLATQTHVGFSETTLTINATPQPTATPKP